MTGLPFPRWQKWAAGMLLACLLPGWAQAGIEWGMYQVLVAQGGSACPASPQNLSFGGALSAFTVTVECRGFPADETGHTPNPFSVFRLVSTACNNPMAGACPNTSADPGARYVERRVQGTIAP